METILEKDIENLNILVEMLEKENDRPLSMEIRSDAKFLAKW